MPASALRPLIGDPLRIIAFDNNVAHMARFWLPGGKATYFLVSEERGYVKGFDIFSEVALDGVLKTVPPDPSGVHLGDTLDTVKTMHPAFRAEMGSDGSPQLIGPIVTNVAAVYEFANGRVRGMHWISKLDDARPDLAPISEPAGDSEGHAILNLQPNETEGVDWEYRYIAFHPCAENAAWKFKQQALRPDGRRTYDVLHVVCPPTKAERDFYFDITSFFGKL